MWRFLSPPPAEPTETSPLLGSTGEPDAGPEPPLASRLQTALSRLPGVLPTIFGAGGRASPLFFMRLDEIRRAGEWPAIAVSIDFRRYRPGDDSGWTHDWARSVLDRCGFPRALGRYVTDLPTAGPCPSHRRGDWISFPTGGVHEIDSRWRFTLVPLTGGVAEHDVRACVAVLE